MSEVVVEGDADQVRVGPGKIYVGAFGEVSLPTTLAGVLDETALYTDGYREAGFTIEGSVVNYSQTSEGVEVAERLRPIKFIITAVEMTFEVALAQMNAENLRLATNAAADAIATTAEETVFTWPKSGGTARVSLVWVSEDGLEALVLAKAFAGGDISIPRRKGAEPTSIGITFNIEENAGGEDAWYIQATSLAA
jgi:hypothetical protein